MIQKISIELDKKVKLLSIIFDIKGDNETGLDKSIVNCIRRHSFNNSNSRFRTDINNSILLSKKIIHLYIMNLSQEQNWILFHST